MTEEEFDGDRARLVRDARHPKFEPPVHGSCVYRPQVELLEYLRANGFKTFIVSGGGIDFIRAFAEEAYGIPPEQVIGSSAKLRFELQDGRPRR